MGVVHVVGDGDEVDHVICLFFWDGPDLVSVSLELRENIVFRSLSFFLSFIEFLFLLLMICGIHFCLLEMLPELHSETPLSGTGVDGCKNSFVMSTSQPQSIEQNDYSTSHNLRHFG
jgi:hypothetical protein